MHSAAVLAFLGDTLDLDELHRVVVRRGLQLKSTRDTHAGVAHLNGDPDALVTELIRLARLGVAFGLWANELPGARVGDAFAVTERRLRKR